MKVISVVNTKGGTGKSTIATNIATALAENNKVLLIDTDKKQESSMSFSQIRNDFSELPDISAITIPYKSIFKDIKNYDNFDYVVIDAGAGDNELVRAAILCGTYGMLLMPVQPGAYDIWATEDTLALVESCRNIIDLDNCWLILNRVNTNKNIKMMADIEESVKELCTSHNIRLMETKLYDRVAYKEAICQGRNVIEYSKIKKDNGKAAEELKQLVKEILEILKAI